MAQYFKDVRGSVFAVLVDEAKNGRYKMASFNTEETGETTRTACERSAAMKRLYLKMVDQYPEADVDLVQIIGIDADQVSEGNEDPTKLSRRYLEAEVVRLRLKLAALMDRRNK